MGAILPDEMPTRPAMLSKDAPQTIEVRAIEIHHGPDDTGGGVGVPVEHPNAGGLRIRASTELAGKRLILVSQESDGVTGGLVRRRHLEQLGPQLPVCRASQPSSSSVER